MVARNTRMRCVSALLKHNVFLNRCTGPWTTLYNSGFPLLRYLTVKMYDFFASLVPKCFWEKEILEMASYCVRRAERFSHTNRLASAPPSFLPSLIIAAFKGYNRPRYIFLFPEKIFIELIGRINSKIHQSCCLFSILVLRMIISQSF